MIARLQRWLLTGQVLIGVIVAVWLAASDRLPVWAAVAVGLLAPFTVQIALLTIEFTVAWAARGARPGEVPRGGFVASLWAWLVAWARELVDSTRTFSFAQPLLAGRPFPVGAVSTEKLPVLLVHGYFCNRALWRPMAARIAAAGHAVDAVDLEPPFASIDDYAPRIAAAVDALRARTGAARIGLVGHSMGGLAIRSYLRSHGDTSVACVVTLGTPHQGTLNAQFGHGRNVRQMRRNSPWLQALAASESPQRLALFTVVISWQDNIVVPQAVQTLPGSRTVMLHGLGHVSLAYDPSVSRIVLEALSAAEDGRARPSA